MRTRGLEVVTLQSLCLSELPRWGSSTYNIPCWGNSSELLHCDILKCGILYLHIYILNRLSLFWCLISSSFLFQLLGRQLYEIASIQDSLFCQKQSHIQDVLNTTTENNIKLTCDQTLQQKYIVFQMRLLFRPATSTCQWPNNAAPL